MQAEFELIAPYVTAFSLMTYDYSHPQRYGSACLNHSIVISKKLHFHFLGK